MSCFHRASRMRRMLPAPLQRRSASGGYAQRRLWRIGRLSGSPIAAAGGLVVLPAQPSHARSTSRTLTASLSQECWYTSSHQHRLIRIRCGHCEIDPHSTERRTGILRNLIGAIHPSQISAAVGTETFLCVIGTR
jgi:hypothetical protein